MFDVYEGKGIDAGKKSIAIAVTIQPREKTMTDQEIDAVAAKIVAEVSKKTGGMLAGMTPQRAKRFTANTIFPHSKGMSLSGLIPAGVSIDAAIAICVIAFVAGTARGFSGFGSALIFMPLASSVAAPRLVATLLLIIDFVAATPLLPNAWRHADRQATAVMVLGALVGVPMGTYFLIRLDPVTARWIISGFVVVLLILLLSGWRYRGPDHPAISAGVGALSGFGSGLAQTGGPPIVGYWLGRPISSIISRANIVLFFGASDCFSLVSYALHRPDHIGCDLVLGFGRSGLCHRRLVRRRLVRPCQRNAVPCDLLHADRSGGDHRLACARRRAALIDAITKVRHLLRLRMP